jgi:CBS domain-containing protein
MTTDVQTATEDTALEEIVRLMERRRIKRVPILRGQKLVGIVSRANLLRALANIAREVPPPRPEDGIIRERLLAELKKQNWAPVGTIDAIVRGGVVTLSGLLTDERQREALLVAAQNIPGVVKVEDDMVWMDPVSGTFLQPPKIS